MTQSISSPQLDGTLVHRVGGGGRNIPLHATETRISSGLMGRLVLRVLYSNDPFRIRIALTFTIVTSGYRNVSV